MNKQIKKIAKFFNEVIWDTNDEHLSVFKRQLYKQIRIFSIAIKRYLNQEGNLSASALTFFTLLSIVPVLAMIFGIAKGFGLDGVLENQIRKNLYGQDEVVEKLIEFSRTLLENTHGGIVAGIGFAIVFYSVLKLLNSIEEAFNKAWGINKPRSFYRKFTDYTSFIVIAPVLFTISSSISLYVISGLQDATDNLNMSSVFDTAVTFMLEILSFALIWLLMILIYMLLPNIKVSWKAGIQSGILIGTFFIITQWIYVNFQIGAARANAIYGSFAALPLFLVWLQTSWFIIVFGAVYTYAVQNEKLYRKSVSPNKLSDYNLKKTALLIAYIVVQDFEKGSSPTKESTIVEQLKIPNIIVSNLVKLLIKSKVITEVVSKKERSFLPAIDIQKLTISYVLNALEQQEAQHWKFPQISASEKIEQALLDFKGLIANKKGSLLLADL